VQMKTIGTAAAVVALLGASWGQMPRPDVNAPKFLNGEVRPFSEMQSLFDAFVGSWQVSETFETSTSQQGKMREGTASFRAGPGYSLLEDYQSNGSAGELNFLALLWWDRSAHLYRLLTCANNDGCRQRGTVKWEGKELVNSWEEKVDGKTAIFKDSFVDISPTSFRLISEGTADGKAIWRVITKYERLAERKR
jgi:hypothetical protein